MRDDRPGSVVGESGLRLAVSRPVVLRALGFAVVVGLILALINHGDAIARGDLPPSRIARILLTFFVPYVVSTLSSVGALRQRER